jgi:hypothetical protein
MLRFLLHFSSFLKMFFDPAFAPGLFFWAARLWVLAPLRKITPHQRIHCAGSVDAIVGRGWRVGLVGFEPTTKGL